MKIKNNVVVSKIVVYLKLITILFLSAIVFNLFLYPSKITTGGTTGISIIISSLIKIDPSIIILIESIILLALSYFFLTKEKTAVNLSITLLYPLLIKLTSNIESYIHIENDMIVMSIYAGLIGGICTGITYKLGYSNGGLNIISQILYKYFKISLTKTTIIMNMTIVLIGGYLFGHKTVYYAIIVLITNYLASNKVLLGISQNKVTYIVTKKEKEITSYLKNTLKSEITIINNDKKSSTILIVIPKQKYNIMKKNLIEIDSQIFFSTNNVYQSSKHLT